jgi:peptidoglycan-associated lipoprotein
MSQKIGFDYGSAAIRPAGRPILDRKVALLRDNPSLRIQIAGHTDSRSSDGFNQALGLRRAEATRAYLTRAGIAANRIDVISFGETRPFDTATTRAARARNRRAEFTVAG